MQPEFYTVTIEIGVPSRNLSAVHVHEALCQYLHEECINFEHDGVTIEFVNVEEVKPTPE